MIRFYAILCCLIITDISKAQLSKSFSINFESNSYALSLRQLKFIDSLIQSLPNIPEAYIVEAKGHTDNVGSITLNSLLSKNRSTSVLNYLKTKNFKTSDSSMKFYGFDQPLLENTNENLWRNRRVEINLYARKLNMVKILGVKDFVPKLFKFNEDIGGTLNYDSTKIVIVPNSFLHKNGNEVIGEIDINYIEYRNPSDFLLSGIPMSINDDGILSHFNSGGMFNISASQSGEQLVLKNEKEKTVFFDFPLSNLFNQNFYRFDTTIHKWDNNSSPITNLHGNVLFPFGASSNSDSATISNNRNFNSCVPIDDTCAYIKQLIIKLNYFVSHEEPIRLDYPYKFTKNSLVDFKSPLYELKLNKENNTFQFISRNKHNKLGVFNNYVWKYNPEDLKKDFVLDYNFGFTYIKIISRNGLKFKLILDNFSVNVTGEPINFKEENEYKKPFLNLIYGSKSKAYLAKLKYQNKKNFKHYRNYTEDLDRKEFLLESELRDKDKFYVNKHHCSDSLNCLDYFYRTYLYTFEDKEILNINNFNLHKDKLATKLKGLPNPFTCDDAVRLLLKKDSINRVFIAKRDSSINLSKQTFAKFGINSTGIYNADQVKHISNPIEILASYKSDVGIPLKIISIFVSIKGLNGIINYNGYMGYGPYKFVYGKNDQTMLIAVDENEKSYYCSPEEFSKFVKNKQNNIVNFVLKLLRNVESSSNLQKIVLN